MLRKLTVENYALIDSLEMELGEALNIITGETGAGKSILLGALGLVLGSRTEESVLKDKSRNCVVEAMFDISQYGLSDFFEANELEWGAQTVIRRIVTPSGKSRAYVNDCPIQLTVLKELGSRLIDIHSQHQNMMLSNDRFRTSIVDSLSDDAALLESYCKNYAQLLEARNRAEQIQSAATENSREEEYLRYQVAQFDDIKLRDGELNELEQRQKELANAEQIGQTLSQLNSMLEEDETGILLRLKSAVTALHRIVEVYPAATSLAERIDSDYVDLKELGRDIFDENERIESNPAELEAVETRMNAIYTLMQKHKCSSMDELMAVEKDFRSRLNEIDSFDEQIQAARELLRSATAEATATAAKISKARQKGASKLSIQVVAMLARLGMPAVKFEAEVTPTDELSPSGADRIRFLFTANSNMTPQPVEKIASGGEISRLMLCLKAEMARNTKLPTIIFDEIDTGVSGRIADAMGEIINSLARSMQVINITHLPQVASKGEDHFRVYKSIEGSQTVTRIEHLTTEQRIEEIAKMLSGSEVTEAATAQARALLGC